MAENSENSIGMKLLMGFGILCIGAGLFNFIGSFIGSDDNEKANTEINLRDVASVQSAIQGKWNESLPSSVSSESLYFRLLIEGNKVSIWEKIGFNDWDMNRPADEVHTITIGDITKNVDGVPCRYLYWDGDETLLTRSIGILHVTDCCILFRGSVRILKSGWD